MQSQEVLLTIQPYRAIWSPDRT
nr:unnamed protein product [Callosobruchus chinensis]